jgi:DNA end-binding protein Ku
MYAATKDSAPSFHLLHQPDMGRIGYRKVCKAEAKEVPADEIVRAFEVAPGEMVVLTDEEIAAAAQGHQKRIDLAEFVPYEQIDPIYFEKTYYLGPAPGAERVYALLAEAMEQSGLAAIGRYVFHGAEHLAALRVRDGLMLLARLYFAEEIRDPQGIAPEDEEVVERELDLARQLIAATATNFDPGRYRDEFRERIVAAVEAKRETGAVQVADEEPTTPVPDVLEALTQSLARARPTSAPGKEARAPRKSRARR